MVKIAKFRPKTIRPRLMTKNSLFNIYNFFDAFELHMKEKRPNVFGQFQTKKAIVFNATTTKVSSFCSYPSILL